MNTKAGATFAIAFLALGAFQAVTGIFDEEGDTPAAHAASNTSPVKPEGHRPTEGKLGTPYKKPGSAWISGYHTGIDFIVPAGTPVRAADRGSVVSAGWGGQYGNQIVIRHEDGTYTQYAHLSRIDVRAGSTVTGGKQIGLSGATGNAFGPHLHFEARTGPDYGSDIDPVAWLSDHGTTV
ncbi:M23 family metallopeptidase [Streptomyces sp. 5-10]|uniref:M23 family metallopeptidase n=1 Tax=Streptomyces sp. 5-10 TaxID=878925 RepID=UPI00168BE497|nr:M23 family metallopeptidase [Streptomyces sp. 5-10]